MNTRRTKELMTLTLGKAIEQYLLILTAEGKSPRYIAWLKERLGYFTIFIHKTRPESDIYCNADCYVYTNGHCCSDFFTDSDSCPGSSSYS